MRVVLAAHDEHDGDEHGRERLARVRADDAPPLELGVEPVADRVEQRERDEYQALVKAAEDSLQSLELP